MNTEKIPDWILKKMYRYCAYQERSQYDVMTKLREMSVSHSLTEQVLNHLREENFINDERFAKAFVRGKFNYKSWGRNKIRFELKKKQIPDFLIEKGMNEIDEEEYRQMLFRILRKKNTMIREKDIRKRREKLVNFARSKGYEQGLIWQLIQEMEKGQDLT